MTGSVSPSTITWTRRGARPPEVGFCRGVSPESSSRLTVHTARIGSPVAVKTVYFAETLLTYDRKPVSPPHLKITHGGEPFFLSCELGVGTQQANRRSTDRTTLSSCFSVASKNISRLSLEG